MSKLYPITTTKTLYPHGSYYLRGDRMHGVCHSERFFLPEGFQYDMTSFAELDIDASGSTHFTVKVVGRHPGPTLPRRA